MNCDSVNLHGSIFTTSRLDKTCTTWLESMFNFFLNLLKCALWNQSLEARYKAGNVFVGFFWQHGVKACLELLWFESQTLRFPPRCHGHSATAKYAVMPTWTTFLMNLIQGYILIKAWPTILTARTSRPLK